MFLVRMLRNNNDSIWFDDRPRIREEDGMNDIDSVNS